MKQYPAVGWVRANSVSPEAAQEVLGLRHQVEELQAQLDQVAVVGPKGVENLAQGGDSFTLDLLYEKKYLKSGRSEKLYWAKECNELGKVSFTWAELFAAFALPCSSFLPWSFPILRAG